MNNKAIGKRDYIAFILLGIFMLLVYFSYSDESGMNMFEKLTSSNDIKVLSSYENRDLEDVVKKYAKKENIDLSFTYMGDLDIVEELNKNKENYDAVWISNSIWLYMLENTYTVSESKSITISPVVMGIKKNKASELGLINKEIYNKDLLDLIKNKQIKYVMSSVTQTNTGATAYLGFLNSLAGSPEVLTSEMLDNENLINDMKNVFSGVERVSGDEEYLEEMFINGDLYEAIITSESSLISINKKLKQNKKEELYLIYPKDGVAINDSTFAYIDNGLNKNEKFLTIQKYLLDDEFQQELIKLGRRTWYGGTNDKVDKTVFNPSWGIDTNKYLITTKYPSKIVMTKAINLYIEELRKQTHVVFCLDYSGSMNGDRIYDLRNAMDYILSYDKASSDKLQFSKGDKITVVTFSSGVNYVWTSTGHDTESLIKKINSADVGGGTALYDAVIKGFEILENESDDYTKTIIAMTDGEINSGYFNQMSDKYDRLDKKIPVYSIAFGNANEEEILEIANYTNAKVFDGRNELLQAFKEVRGYN